MWPALKRRYFVSDAETDPFLHGRVPNPFVWGTYDGRDFDVWWEDGAGFVEWLAEQDRIAYAHNGGRFDWVFMAEFLSPDQRIGLIDGRLARAKLGNCELRDSWLLYPTALAGYHKEKFNYDKMEAPVRERHRDEIVEYLRSDCLYLWELLEAFWAEHGRYPLTLPQASVKALGRIQGVRIPTGRETFDELFRPWYFGGRCQAFKTGSWDSWRGEIVDINSAYPHAMKTLEHPWGFRFRESKTMPPEPELPHSLIMLRGISNGALPQRSRDSRTPLQYPDGDGIFFATGHEVIAGLETGTLRIDRVLRAYTPEQTMRFDGFVDHYWQQKIAAKKSGDEARTYCAKITLNGLYGKFAQDPRRFLDWRLVRPIEATGWTQRVPLGPNYAVAEPSKSGRFYNVATAASITGAVRAKLWRAICESRDVRYCDTDSLICGQACVARGEGLGQWGSEGLVSSLHVAGRKLYAAQLRDGTSKLASKGVRLTFDEIREVARGGSVEWRNPAPSLGLLREPGWVSRTVQRKV